MKPTADKEAMLTLEEMVEVIWKSGNEYEAEGYNINTITQALRFQWIARAAVAKLERLGYERKEK